MSTNIALDDNLVREAMRVGGHRTKAAAVARAIEDYIQRRKQREILDLFGKIEMLSESVMKRQRTVACGPTLRARRA